MNKFNQMNRLLGIENLNKVLTSTFVNHKDDKPGATSEESVIAGPHQVHHYSIFQMTYSR